MKSFLKRIRKTNQNDQSAGVKKEQKKDPKKPDKKETKKDDKPKFDYLVKCLLNPEIKKGDVVKVESNSFTGNFKVLEMDISDFVMSLKCKVQN